MFQRLVFAITFLLALSGHAVSAQKCTDSSTVSLNATLPNGALLSSDKTTNFGQYSMPFLHHSFRQVKNRFRRSD
jgi:hypothetical protein